MFEQFERLHKNLKNTNLSNINFFEILGVHHNEVLICRLIGFLLTPNAAYGIHTESLRLFLSMLTSKTYNKADFNRAHIVLEEPIEDDRRVDIVIYIAEDIFPLEVKIRAEDERSQLFDYYQHFKRQNPKFSKIWYLTPDQHCPSLTSITSKDGSAQLDVYKDINCLSFEQLLENWLKKIHTVNQSYQMLIDQFKDVIVYMTSAEHNKREIYRELALTDADFFRIEGKVQTVLALMALNQQDLWNSIRDRYLRKCLDYEKDLYELAEDNGDDIQDRFCLYAVIHKESRKKVAWICVEKNLYIVCKQKFALDLKGSDSYFWQYLNPNHKAEAFPLRTVNPSITDDDKIDIRRYLVAPTSDSASSSR